MSQGNILAGRVVGAAPNLKGFDTNTVVTAATAEAFVKDGFQFCVRYVGRNQMAPNDLTTNEANTILDAGLALMVVQHVSQWGWSPNGALGAKFGSNAAAFSAQIGIPKGVTIWLDLEGVAAGTPAQSVSDYCNSWYDQVAARGFVPGIYIGAQAILTSGQLYSSLKFQHYWKSGSTVPNVAQRGYQMTQFNLDITMNGIQIDEDKTQNDQLGGQVQWLVRP